jgi:NADH:ubiquinone oxidoreductase subunit C
LRWFNHVQRRLRSALVGSNIIKIEGVELEHNQENELTCWRFEIRYSVVSCDQGEILGIECEIVHNLLNCCKNTLYEKDL